MPKSLADGHIKFALLATKPADPKAVTVAELTAGIDASCRVLAGDFNIGPSNSETVNEKELCVEGNAVAFGASNAAIEFSPFRYFDEAGAADPGDGTDDIGDAVFQAVKEKGTRLWAAVRETSKLSTDPWEAGDEVDVYEFITDNPQRVDLSGYIKRRTIGGFQNMWLNGTVVDAAPAG